MIKVSASLLAADPLRYGEEIASAREAGADWLHFDVMDGAFVPNISFGQTVLPACASTGVFCDVHLMIREPDKHIASFAQCGAGAITVHAEACAHLPGTLRRIREAGCMAGVAISPETPAERLEGVLPYADLVLVMTVHPGFGGQKLIPLTVRKIGQLRGMIAREGGRTLISVDGGVTAENCGECAREGADVLVAGSALFRAADRAAFVRALHEA